ncbi:hypothetical protein [Streptomyces sp. NPDC005180]|uniref:hypothetical protein n=1 Tax=unclassified Streptomyces TaxID=2593676 RepID=UPI0033A2FF05
MPRSSSSRLRDVKKRYQGAVLALVAALSLTACDPATPASSTPSASAKASANTVPSVTPAASPTPTPSADAATASSAPAIAATTKAPAVTQPAPAPPAPTHPRTEAPVATKAATDCYPRSNAGNCYKAGQICRKADIGTSGRDAGGRAIHCREDSSVGQRWGY